MHLRNEPKAVPPVFFRLCRVPFAEAQHTIAGDRVTPFRRYGVRGERCVSIRQEQSRSDQQIEVRKGVAKAMRVTR
jgi:hypothetical protein